MLFTFSFSWSIDCFMSPSSPNSWSLMSSNKIYQPLRVCFSPASRKTNRKGRERPMFAHCFQWTRLFILSLVATSFTFLFLFLVSCTTLEMFWKIWFTYISESCTLSTVQHMTDHQIKFIFNQKSITYLTILVCGCHICKDTKQSVRTRLPCYSHFFEFFSKYCIQRHITSEARFRTFMITIPVTCSLASPHVGS